MVNSACGHCRAIRDCSSALIAATRSSGRVRDTETMTSPTILAPLGRRRIASIPATLVSCMTRRADRVGQPLGRAVDERVDRRAAEAIACDGDEAGDADRRQRVGMGEARAGGDKADEDQDGGDEIARIVQRVGAERVARGRARRMGQRAPAHDVDDDREHDRADGEGVDVDRSVAAADALDRLDRDADRERGEKAGLGQRRHRLDLGVAEWMIGVGGLVGLAHGEEGQRARADVDRVMRAFREKRERAGSHARCELERRQDCARDDRGRRRALLQRRVVLGRMARLRLQSERPMCPGASP